MKRFEPAAGDSSRIRDSFLMTAGTLQFSGESSPSRRGGPRSEIEIEIDATGCHKPNKGDPYMSVARTNPGPRQAPRREPLRPALRHIRGRAGEHGPQPGIVGRPR